MLCRRRDGRVRAPAMIAHATRWARGRWAARRRTPGVLDRENLVDWIRASVIGDDTVIEGPFGGRRLVYADYTASGRARASSRASSARKASALREHAHRGVGHRVADDAAARGRSPPDPPVRWRLPRGRGHLLRDGVDGRDRQARAGARLRLPATLDDRYRLSERIPEAERPLVFVGPYEHHSNELPWRESIADVVTIGLDADGGIDVDELQEEAAARGSTGQDRQLLRLPSNVTGIVTDVDRIAVLLHRHGALSCWDYASAGPYLPIEMNPSSHRLAYKDAVFLFPTQVRGWARHARRARGQAIAVPQRGAVRSGRRHDLVCDPDRALVPPRSGGARGRRGCPRSSSRSEPGSCSPSRTPSEPTRSGGASRTSRAGPSSPGAPTRESRSSAASSGSGLPSSPSGCATRQGCCTRTSSPRLSTTCSASRRGVVASAPAPTSTDSTRSTRTGRGRCTPRRRAVNSGQGSRSCAGFNYFTSEAVFDYVLRAVHFLADHGWKLLPLYRFEPSSGLWEHAGRPPRRELGLEDISYGSGRLRVPPSARHRARKRAPALPRGSAADRDRPRGSAAGGRQGPRIEPEPRGVPLVPAAGRGVGGAHARRGSLSQQTLTIPSRA